VSRTVTHLKVAAFAACVFAACDDRAMMRLELEDGAYLRGDQISRLEISAGIQVVRSELFLDGLRVAADDFAPFELHWDTRSFGDGAHRLAARFYLGDGSYADSSTSIWIDNTPPSLGDLGSAAVMGRSFDIPASDNLGVAQVEISDGAAERPPVILTASPYRFTWQWSCGPMTLHIRVVDRAGGETVVDRPIASVESLDDQDCDGHKSLAAGGDDCNDADAMVYPGAFEYLDGVDRDCDGAVATLEGVDADHDGVASFASGGDDCNDADPNIHGRSLVFAHEQVLLDGEPVHWNPGEAAVSFDGVIYLNRDGRVQQLHPGSNATVDVVTVAADANPASIAVAPNSTEYLAYGRGNQVVIAQSGPGAWTTHAVIDANGRVGRIAFLPPDRDAEYAMFQAGTEIWFASSNDGAAWKTQLLVDAAAPLAEAPLLDAAPDGADIAFRTEHAAWKASRRGVTAPLTIHEIGPAGAAPSAIAQYWGAYAVVAVDDGTGALLYGSHLGRPLRFPRKITSMFAEGSYLYVQLDGLGLQILNVANGLRRVQSVPEVGAFDTAIYGAVAGNGYVDYDTWRSVHGPADSPGDHIDQNCDGSDD